MESTMEFTRIRCLKGSVELDYTEMMNGAKQESTLKGKDPTAALRGALQSFGSYAQWVLSAPESWTDSIDVFSVSISRPEDQPRGITVAVLKKCTRARNSTCTINTPYLSQAPDGGKGDGTGFLPKHVPDLIDELEAAALAYHGGERGEQTALPLGDSGNASEVDERMAAASSASTRKAKGKKKDHVPGVGTVVNPEPVEELTDDNMRQLLGSVGRDVPVEAIARWTSSEREMAQRWAKVRQQEIVGSLPELAKVPAEPPCVLRDATPALDANNWEAPPPRKKTSDELAKAKDEVKRAIEGEPAAES